MSARDRILARLRNATKQWIDPPKTVKYYQEQKSTWTEVERLRHWAHAMRAVNTEIYWVRGKNWLNVLIDIVQKEKLRSMVLANGTAYGIETEDQLKTHTDLKVYTYTEKLEDWKHELFNEVEASLTTVKCGIAETGTLLLWPNEQEPRTMSLIPEVHIALFDVNTMKDSFIEAMLDLGLDQMMPTNIVLISGPSKTADIQMTLAYGAHGPKKLIVLAKVPDHIALDELEEMA